VSFAAYQEDIKEDGVRTQTPYREERARRNLSRLVANHRRVAGSLSGTTTCGSQATLSKVVRTCLPGQKSCGPTRHAMINGDVMFIGTEPGLIEDVLMLTEAEVEVLGTTVSISRKGAATVYQTLATEKEAQKWAVKVRAASGLWSSLEKLTEAALQGNSQTDKDAEEEVSRADTGGTAMRPLQAMESGSASLEKNSAKHPAGGLQSPRPAEPWVALRSTTGESETMLPGNETSTSWSWMRSLFGGPPAVLVA